MSTEVQRLEAELALAKLSEKLEAAREVMHADRSKKNIAAYKAACEVVAAARKDWRENHRVTSKAPGDASPEVSTISVKAGVKL